MGAVFVLPQVLGPLRQAVCANLGFQTAAWLYDQLTVACVEPSGMAHLEDLVQRAAEVGSAARRWLEASANA